MFSGPSGCSGQQCSAKDFCSSGCCGSCHQGLPGGIIRISQMYNCTISATGTLVHMGAAFGCVTLCIVVPRPSSRGDGTFHSLRFAVCARIRLFMLCVCASSFHDCCAGQSVGMPFRPDALLAADIDGALVARASGKVGKQAAKLVRQARRAREPMSYWAQRRSSPICAFIRWCFPCYILSVSSHRTLVPAEFARRAARGWVTHRGMA